MARKRVADVLVDTLVVAGVRRVYGLVGDSLNGVTDSIRPRKAQRQSALPRRSHHGRMTCRRLGD
jgi:thiamine pyrophosphate-dependent acetolactate synthase large subunit-like protein